jgi:hypothetical protein
MAEKPTMKIAPRIALCIALPLLAGCADESRPNERGGTHYSTKDILAGRVVTPKDSCDICCEPGHQLPWCDDGSDGEPSGGTNPDGGHVGYECWWVCWAVGSGMDAECRLDCAYGPPNGGTGNWP